MKNLLIAVFLLIAHHTLAQLKEIRNIQHKLPFIKNEKARIDALNQLAFFMQLKSPDSSYHLANEARELATKLKYKKGMADAYKTFGGLLLDQNSYLCARYLHDALDLYREIGFKQGEAMTLMNISNLLYVDRDSTHARAYLMQAYRLGQTLKKDSVLAIILINMLYRDTCIQCAHMDIQFKKGLAIAQKYHDERMILSYQQLQGYILWNRGDCAKGVKILENELPLCDSTGDEFEKMNIYQRLCDWLIDKQPDKALYYYRQALSEADRYKFPLRSIVFAGSLYDYYRSKNNSKEALKYAAIIMDADHKKEQELKKYNFNTIGFIIRDTDLKLAVERERAADRLLVFFIILSILVLVLLFVVYRSFRISKKYALLQAELKERTQARNLELEQWNDFYDMLLSVLAHDLRQPFSSIIMTTDLLNFKKNIFSEQELVKTIRELKDTAEQSIELLHGILCWIKARKTGFQYKTQPLLLYDLINEANSLCLFDQRKENIRLINEIPKKQIIHAHEQMLLFICRNILSNATKYTMPGGRIRVYTFLSANKTVVAFEDKGKGMSSEEISKLFSISDKTILENAAVQGAGIALTIAYEMSQQMSGKLWAESEIDKGTTFYMEFPDPFTK